MQLRRYWLQRGTSAVVWIVEDGRRMRVKMNIPYQYLVTVDYEFSVSVTF